MESWNRLEAHSADKNLNAGLAARLADPLWSLARQWQIGEFKGEDAASPIAVTLKTHSSRIASYRDESAPGQEARKLAAGRPLEPIVEAEAVMDGPSAIAQAVEAGTQFLRRLATAGLTSLRVEVDWVGLYGFDWESESLELAALPEGAQRKLGLFAARCPDGRRLFAANNTALLSKSAAGDTDAFRVVLKAWREEYAGRFEGAESGPSAWVEERLEYDFSVAAKAGGGEVVLRVNQHTGDRLDWYSYQMGDTEPHGIARQRAERRELKLLPQPVTFSGQPAARWWEFEDRRVYFGNLSAGPADITRLVVSEFASTFSDDWFVVPLRVGVGTLNRVSRLEVTDVFGGKTRIRSLAENDHASGDRPFRFFEIEGDDSVANGKAPWLLIPPVLDTNQHRVVEDVTFVRDEQANLAWGIESRIELPTGSSMRRRQSWQRSTVNGVDSGSIASGQEAGTWRYQAQSSIPPWWIPLVPERTGEGASMRLRRARMQSWSEVEMPGLAGPKGEILGVQRPLFIQEEEVPRGGVRVTRSWRRCRSADGSVQLWQGRRKRPGRGDRGSGLEFDSISK